MCRYFCQNATKIIIKWHNLTLYLFNKHIHKFRFVSLAFRYTLMIIWDANSLSLPLSLTHSHRTQNWNRKLTYNEIDAFECGRIVAQVSSFALSAYFVMQFRNGAISKCIRIRCKLHAQQTDGYKLHSHISTIYEMNSNHKSFDSNYLRNAVAAALMLKFRMELIVLKLILRFATEIENSKPWNAVIQHALHKMKIQRSISNEFPMNNFKSRILFFANLAIFVYFKHFFALFLWISCSKLSNSVTN